jgi:hypothetical protein
MTVMLHFAVPAPVALYRLLQYCRLPFSFIGRVDLSVGKKCLLAEELGQQVDCVTTLHPLKLQEKMAPIRQPNVQGTAGRSG